LEHARFEEEVARLAPPSNAIQQHPHGHSPEIKSRLIYAAQ
jgi:hypothetical protein